MPLNIFTVYGDNNWNAESEMDKKLGGMYV